VWVALLLFAFGLIRLCERAFERLAPRISAGAARALAAGGAALFAAGAISGLLYLHPTIGVAPLGLDLGYAIFCLALAAFALWPRAREPRALGLGLWLAGLALLATVVLVGAARRRMELRDIHDANYASVVLADWLRGNLAPDERIVVLSRSHLLFLGALSTSFEKTDAETSDELARWMRDNDFSHVAYTYRKPVHNPAAGYYHRTLRAFVADPFRDGGEVPGFEHVATLRVPPHVEESDVQVYRLRR
jgi:hypothetical protein